MARITLVDTSIPSLYLQDLDRKQRESIHPPGQDRYIHPIDTAAVAAKLVALGSAVTAAALIAGTVTADDISLANIDAVVADVVLTADQQQEVQDLLSYRLVETGHFKLSFDRGVIAGMITEGWVKVYPDDAAGLYSL